MTRHYCYVPGHGAYMLSDEPASEASVPAIGASSSLLCPIAPPRRSLRFSAFHSHDDGILANLLMEAEGMTYDEACRYIERQVPLLTDDFIDQALADIDTDNYGFDEIRLESWKDIEQRLNPPAPVEVVTPQIGARANADAISIPKVWLKRVAMIALVVVFFFTNFIGLNLNDGQQMAAVFNLPTWSQATPDTDADEDNTFDDQLAMMQPVNAIVPQPSVSDAVAEPVNAIAQPTVAQQPAATPAQPAVETSLQALDHYYIIIASTVSREEAEAVSLRYARQGYTQAGVLVCGNLYRVFAQSFDDRDEAAVYLQSLRTSNERLAKSWLFTLSDPSLSSIIKNKYNDNQLSMELSHPNTRTERDQG